MERGRRDLEEANRKQILLNVQIGKEVEKARSSLAQSMQDISQVTALPNNKAVNSKAVNSSGLSLPAPSSLYNNTTMPEMSPYREAKKKVLESYKIKSTSSSPLVGSVTPGSIINGVVDQQSNAHPDIPPFVFRRLPRLDQPIVNLSALKEMDEDKDKAGVVEGWLDKMFSNDSIYEGVIRKLREQILQLQARNNMLESNLDTAEIEIEYWRDIYTKNAQVPLGGFSAPPTNAAPVSAGPNRRISERCWKLAVSKFVGTGDQFAMMKVLFHWRMYIESKDKAR